MFIYLPFEILHDIFGFIDENDIATLHSTLLVNRAWCQSIVQYLWKKPFNICPLLKNIHKIIPVILSSLNAQRKEYLRIKDSQLGVPINTLFDYSRFIKQIHFGHIHDSIQKWMVETKNFRFSINHYNIQNDKFSNSNNQMTIEYQEIFAFFEAIFDVITSNCENIQVLYLSSRHVYIPFYPILLSTPNARNCLMNLENFNCIDNCFREELFNTLIQVSQNIRSIYVDLYKYDHTEKDGEAFKNLIKAQNRLENFIINYYYFSDLSGILVPLKYQAHSLKSIKICIGVIRANTLQFLTSCTQLEELIFNQVEFADGLNVFANFFFPNLRIFHFNNIYYSFFDDNRDQILYFIRNNKNLQELSLLINLSLYPDKLFEVISENCKNLLFITVRIKDDNEITLLFPILKSQKLKSLFIPLEECEFLITPVTKNVKEFAQNIPSSLVTLDLTRWILDISVLRNLLDNLHYPVNHFNFICNENIDGIKIIINDYSIKNNLEIISFDIRGTAWKKFLKVTIEWKYL